MAVNRVMLIGNLGKDPEVRYTPQGTAVANFSLATSENYKDRDGNRQTKTEWHNIVVWRQLAEICGKYLHKGKQVYIEGKLQTRKYQDRDGRDCYRTEIVADQMQMLGRAGDDNGGGYQNDNQQQSYSKPQQNQPQQQSRQGQGGQQAARPAPVYEEPAFNPDDDIPF